MRNINLTAACSVAWEPGRKNTCLSERNVVLRTSLPSKVTRESDELITVSLATSLGCTATHELPDMWAAQPLFFLTHNFSRHPFIPAALFKGHHRMLSPH